MDEKQFIAYWQEARAKVAKFRILDDAKMEFGAYTSVLGHHYLVAPIIPDKEILAFEAKNKLELPLSYRTFLQHFGAGGAGPKYGICNFKTHIAEEDYTKSFGFDKTVVYSELSDDDDELWEYHGLATITDGGCGVEYHIELKGLNPGTMWCSNSDELMLMSDFYEFYNRWLKRVEHNLKHYHALKQLKTFFNSTGYSNPLTLEQIISFMGCRYIEQITSDSRVGCMVPDNEIWVYFEYTSGHIRLDKGRNVKLIEIGSTFMERPDFPLEFVT